MIDFFGYTSGTPIAITAPNKNPFYLISVGGLHPVELPTEIQNFQRTMADLDGYRITAASAWLDKNPGKTEEDAASWVKSTPSSVWLLFLSAVDRGVVAELLSRVGDFNQNYDLLIATAMMRQRLAWTVQVENIYDAEIGRISIQVPWFSQTQKLQANDRLRWSEEVVAIVSVSDDLVTLDRLPKNAVHNSTMFLLDGQGYRMGAHSWTIDDSRSLLTSSAAKGKSQLAQIVDFYGGESKEEEPEALPLENEGSALESMPDPSPSVGNPFTIDSLILDAVTPESNPTVTFSNAA